MLKIVERLSENKRFIILYKQELLKIMAELQTLLILDIELQPSFKN